MPKGKTKVKKRSRADVVDATLIALTSRMDAADHAIDELDEAICPRVAARLTALERIAEQFKADDVQKAEAIRGLHSFAQRFAQVEAITKNLYRASQKGEQTTAPINSKAEVADIINGDRNLRVIAAIKEAMGIEYTIQGLQELVRLINTTK